MGILDAELHFGRIDDVFDSGLHEHLMHFIDQVYELGERVSKDFLIPTEVA
jgi:uncharacterized alpha-E superfamily protein